MSNICLSRLDDEDKLRVERRTYLRVPGPFDGAWSGASQQCRISSLSVAGCFIECLAPQDKGLRVKVEIELPQEARIAVGAEIIYKETGMGFAVRFVDLGAKAYQMLERTIASAAFPSALVHPLSCQQPSASA